MADSPETSDHTGAKSRLKSLRANTAPKRSIEDFVGSSPNGKGLPFLLKEYLQLIDWTGRTIRNDKRGAIPQSHPPILEQFSLSEDACRKLTTQFEHHFGISQRDRGSIIILVYIIVKMLNDKTTKRPL